MATNEVIETALAKGIISQQTAENLKNYNYRLQGNGVPIIYNLRHLRKILKIKKRDQSKYFGFKRNEYHVFTIPKKSGGARIIEAPSDKLKSYQLWIKENILDKVHISDNAKGFKKACSIVDNAKEHIGKELVVNIDLKDFFPSISYSQVYRIFSYVGYTNEVAHLLTQLCTNNKNVLPQGSPASPSISNIVSLRMDKRLQKLAEKYQCTYTRYADDITFSGTKRIKSILPIVEQIILDEDFFINEKKVRLQYRNQRQEVTGLIVNEKMSVSPRLQRELDNAIYFCQKFGIDGHMQKIDCNKSFYKEHLYGIAYFIKMIDEPKGNYYLSELNKIGWTY